MRLSWLITLTVENPAAAYRYWLGAGDLVFDGETWHGVMGPNGAALAVAVPQSSTGVPDARMQIHFAVADDASLQFFREDRGPMPVSVQFIRQDDATGVWSRLGNAFEGRVSNGDLNIEEGRWSAEIETDLGLDYVEPEAWDHASQQRRHPGDLGFEFAADLASGVEERWP